MVGYLVEEFVENEPTGRAWRVRAADPLEAATKALARATRRPPAHAELRMKVSPRNRFGKCEILDVPAILAKIERQAPTGKDAARRTP